MKVLVTGSRSFTSLEQHKILYKALSYLPDEASVIVGNARGADSLCAWVCQELEIPYAVFKPDWNQHGRSAGMIRNAEMVKLSPDICYAFFDGKRTAGTSHTVKLCRKAAIPVREHGLPIRW